MTSQTNRLQELNRQIRVKLAEGNLDEAEKLSIALIESAEGVKHPEEKDKNALGSIISKFVNSVITRATPEPTPEQVAEIRENAINDEHVRLLSLFHNVVAIMTAVFSLMFLFHIGFGAMMIVNPGAFVAAGTAPQMNPGWVFVTMGVIAITACNIYAALNFYAARLLKRRKRHTFCLVVSGINCMSMPGIFLGVSSIFVLSREKVKATFH